ncbi:MAG: hydroxyphenylacetyl-CoA thioesterase PaaI [Proteobacteria bacterium]|uniref:hydroxyphenylacetyl-CoA thioesterase PaaI n=1 Tax=Thauera sp. 2A1 TaxID=2570191 RepID=UPI00129149A4|nr:hydroxyphenylacetyl-CoA thioesterase PaaI [Thauera sp. 2A1]KAI5915760.1 hydroxyphenylacetyl-CoA thioesterase PaaI [Thauera sp. 2A1]MBS0512060.1 hydroxyphenylacetyl-CoA thioesterase PaaI [Pseudomonadota bacterium]
MTDTQTIPADPQALAAAVAAAMWSRDRAAQALGMRIDSVGPGHATLSMPVRGDMVNGHHICHGGLIFALADTAFAYACNAYNRNTVASGCNIDFVAPGKEGDTLQAEAVERSLSGRTGVYDVTVRDSAGRTVALFRGKSYRIAGEVIAGLAAEQA